jgi:hypothetical protein
METMLQEDALVFVRRSWPGVWVLNSEGLALTEIDVLKAWLFRS